MKKIFATCLLGLASMPLIASAADGTVNFTGSVVATTCTYANGTGSSQTVTLPAVSASALGAGQTGGATPFDIRFTGCGATSKKVAVQLETGSRDANGDLSNTSTGDDAASNVSLRLSNRTLRTRIALPAATAPVDSQADGTATIPLVVDYAAGGGTTKSGKVTASMNFTIIYP